MAINKSIDQAWSEMVNAIQNGKFAGSAANTKAELMRFLATGSTDGLSGVAMRWLHTYLEGTPFSDPQQFYQTYVTAHPEQDPRRANSPIAGAPGGPSTTSPAPVDTMTRVPPALPVQGKGGGFIGGSGLPAGGSAATGDPKNNGAGSNFNPGNTYSSGANAALAGQGAGSSIQQFVQNLLNGKGGAPGAVPQSQVPQRPEYPGGETPPTQQGGQSTGTTDRNSPDYPGNQPVPPAAATTPTATTPGTPTVNGNGVNGPFTTTLADKLAADPQAMMNVALQRLGYSPERPGQVGNFLASIMAPAFDAQAQLGGFQPGNNPMAYDNMNIANDTMGLSGQFMKPGVDAAAQVRGLATNALANPTFMSMLGNPGGNDPLRNQIQMLGFLNQTRTTGLNPLVQSATEAALNQAATKYNMGALGEANGGQQMPVNFLDWLKTQPPEVQKMILGG